MISGRITFVHRIPFLPELLQDCLDVNCIPEPDHIDDQPERTELIFLSFAVTLPQFAPFTAENDVESAPGHGCHGAKGNESSRLVQRIEYYPANALPACRAGRHATEGQAESHRSRTDGIGTERNSERHGLPRFSVQLLLGPQSLSIN